jgi:cytochrome c-type biogenesis protein CcmH
VIRAILAAALLSVLMPAAAHAGGAPSPADLEDELVCPVCNTTLDQSDAPVARQMKQFIRERIRAGDSKSEIKAQLVDSYGEVVLAAPRRRGLGWLAWLLPLVGLGIAAPVVGLLAWRWSRGREPDAQEPLEPELERRLDDELARFEV